jgi:HTH-type transcriptional repressor of NAD biosynthesis genes
VKPKHGLVLGKFYPPHAGHHLLIRTAARACERVTVQVVAAPGERVSSELRAAWLREVHAPERNVEIVAQQGALAADAIFTGEGIGLGLVPISSAVIRRDPVASWEYLAPPVRAHLAKRLVIVGAESTGKTTLALDLRDSIVARGGAFAETRWVPEFGRDYTIDKLALVRADAAWRGLLAPTMDDLVWTTEDFIAIARVQNALEEREARVGGPLLVCDTDTFATGVWHERYQRARAPEVEALADPRPRLYLVTHPDDVSFEKDGIRDGEHLRAWMTDVFVERLRASPHRFEFLRGSRAERVVRACAAVDRWLADGFGKDFVDAPSPLR